jgi:hypothetical protein
MCAAVVTRHDLDVFVARQCHAILVFDARIGEVDVAVECICLSLKMHLKIREVNQTPEQEEYQCLAFEMRAPQLFHASMRRGGHRLSKSVA